MDVLDEGALATPSAYVEQFPFTGLTKYGQTTVIPRLRPRRKPTRDSASNLKSIRTFLVLYVYKLMRGYHHPQPAKILARRQESGSG